MDRAFAARHAISRTDRPAGNRAIAAGTCLLLHAAIIFLFLSHRPAGHVHSLVETEVTLGLPNNHPRPAPPTPASKPVPSPVKREHSSAPALEASTFPSQTARARLAPPSNTSASDNFTIGDAGSGEAHPDFRAVLLDHIARFRRYPAAALGLRLQGTTQVVFTINRAGTLLAVWIAHSSGSEVLDTEALDTIHRSQPFPAIPDDLSDPLTAALPISFIPPSK